jgi:aspartate 1-decarboxylase
VVAERDEPTSAIYPPDRQTNTLTPMLLKLLKAKLHRATVTFTDAHYHGSITIDADLLRSAGLLVNEAVLIADCENGNRFETYIIPGEAGSGVIGINGAAALLTGVGHKVIILGFAYYSPEEAAKHHSKILILDDRNRIAETVDHATTVPSAG